MFPEIIFIEWQAPAASPARLPFSSVCRTDRNSAMQTATCGVTLLADAKGRENTAEELFGRTRAGDFTERALSAAQLLGDQLARARFAALALRVAEVRGGQRECLEVSAARRHRTRVRRAGPRGLEQVPTQLFQPGAGGLP